MKFTKRQNKILYNYFFHLGFIILLIFTIASSVNENHVVINNFNTVKALSSSVLNLIEREEVNFVIDSYQKVFSITEINNYKGKKVWQSRDNSSEKRLRIYEIGNSSRKF